MDHEQLTKHHSHKQLASKFHYVNPHILTNFARVNQASKSSIKEIMSMRMPVLDLAPLGSKTWHQ